MKVRTAILFTLAALLVRPGAEAQQVRPVNEPAEIDKTIASLRQITDDLDNARSNVIRRIWIGRFPRTIAGIEPKVAAGSRRRTPT